MRRAVAQALLENQSFPILQSPTIYGQGIALRLSSWGAMPALHSLRLGHLSVDALPSKTFPALRVLALSTVKGYDYIIQNSYHSLTTLMLDNLHMPYTSETMEFPSLRFLSILRVKNLKPRMSVSALTTYHERNMTNNESFSMPLPLPTEYGTYETNTYPLFNATTLHQCYPNIFLVSIRARAFIVKAFLHSLSGLPTSLPILRILVVGVAFGCQDFSKEDEDSMMDDVFVRNTATSVKMELCFDGKLRAPLYFAVVRVYIKYGRSKLTSVLRTMKPIEDPSFVLSLWPGC